ncbi:MAG: energy transducer TonB, partial [Terriglobia bacterium]
FEVPGILVTPAGPVPPGPVIVGPSGQDATPASPPRVSDRETAAAAKRVERQPTKSAKERAEELMQGIRPGTQPRELAGGRRIYTIYINMPNLTSQTGSWVLRFAELGEESATAPGGAADAYPLESPVPLTKVDPRYPAAARRERVEGSVLLYAVIRRDGTVDSVQLVRGLHELLDQSAVIAFQRWRFQPGRKNGAPVNLEVVVEIPFRLRKLF